MAIAINHCPPHHSCAFLTSILRDMKAQPHAIDAARWTDDQRDGIISSVQRALDAIHACDKAFIKKRYTKQDIANYANCKCK
jgi:hypothetical protein